MRLFLCNFGDFLLGVPTGFVASLARAAEKTDGDIYYHLPDFFGIKAECRHGIILKPQMQDVPQLASPSTLENEPEALPLEGVDYRREVLLVPQVDKVEEFGSEAFSPLPELLLPELPFVEGIGFRGAMIVLASPPRLINFIKQKECKDD